LFPRDYLRDGTRAIRVKSHSSPHAPADTDVHSYYLAHPAREQKPSSQIHGATPFSICAICAHQNADLNGFHFNALSRAAFHFLSSLLTRALIARIHQSALRAAEKK